MMYKGAVGDTLDKLRLLRFHQKVATRKRSENVRCNCKMGCETLRCSCPKAGLECSTGCGECRGICANMYQNITEENEYEEDT